MRQTTLGGSAAPYLAMIALFGVILTGAVSCKTQVWKECRADGHSKAYCFQLISR